MEKTDYIISQRMHLYIQDDDIFVNGNKLEFEGNPIDVANKKKIEMYRDYFSRHFENTVVLTGAGSSYGIGEGNTKGLTMKKLWEKILGECGTEAIQKLADLINYHMDDIDEVNLEEFLSQANLYFRVYPDQQETKGEIVSKIKKAIVQNCTLVMPDNAPHKEFLKRITARKQKYNRLKLFTTNYDMLFEQAANECGFTMIDGFSFTFPRIFNGNNYDYDIVIRKNSRISAQENYAPKVFHLYKLHGSLDWKKHSNTGQIYKCDYENNEHPVMIFPSSLKYEASYEQPFFEMMSRFQNELRMDNTLLIVIGYSFGDKHINSMIYEALELNQSLQLAIVDPYIENFVELNNKAQITSNIILIRSDFNELAVNYPYSYAYGQEEIGDKSNAAI
jgi:hypothetical protein